MAKRKLTKKQYKEKEKRNEAKKLQTELPLPKIPKLSQSLVKSLYNYKIGNKWRELSSNRGAGVRKLF